MYRSSDRVRIIAINASNLDKWQADLHALEAAITYPFGSDTFTIDHGEDYFAFFQRLGEVVCYGAAIDETLVAVAVGVLRKGRAKNQTHKRWYLCDLKVHPKHRGRGLPRRIFQHAFFRQVLRCRRGYAISMNPDSGRENHVVRLLARMPWTPLRHAGNLNIYSLTYDEMVDVSRKVQLMKGPLTFLSLEGKKDLIIGSTGEPIRLLHLQFGPDAGAGFEQPQPDHIHMFCALDTSPFDVEMQKSGLRPSATAALLQHGMKHENWDFILTSDL